MSSPSDDDRTARLTGDEAPTPIVAVRRGAGARFTPGTIGARSMLLDRLHEEVRVRRQVAHPPPAARHRRAHRARHGRGAVRRAREGDHRGPAACDDRHRHALPAGYLETFLGFRYSAGWLLGTPVRAMLDGLVVMTILVVLTMLLRRRAAAAIGLFLIQAVAFFFASRSPSVYPFLLVLGVILTFVVVRVGLLAFVATPLRRAHRHRRHARHSSIRLATSPVQPVWCDAPRPSPWSALKYS